MEIDKKLAYDIGAFDGDTIGMINGIGYSHVVCFEPHPGSFGNMKARHGNNANVTLVNKAVSEKSGENVELIVVPDHPYLNSLEPIWFSTERHPASNTHKVLVETISLDDYIESSGKIPAYIKVDAEGHEISIFKGLHYKPNRMSFEWISEFYEKNETCVRMLHELGFTKFVICRGEALPNYDDKVNSYEECCTTLRKYNETDTDKKAWGNIWCS